MSTEILDRWFAGNPQAAGDLIDLYADRLIALARRQLPRMLNGRIDPEDVVQSVFRSFFRIVRAGRSVGPGADLWQYLASITRNKVMQKVEFHNAQRRAVGRESKRSAEGVSGDLSRIESREPSPEDAAALVDELERAMRGLSPLHRQMVEMTLQGHEAVEIAEAVGRTDRMVRLVLERFREELRCRLSMLGGG